ncbi:MAG: vWA domain-containing protein, partial [Clostridiaceae bacterium]
MGTRKVNFLMLFLSSVGGLIGFFAGEMLLGAYAGKIHNVLLMGMYFGLLALLTGLMCLISELVNPVLNGRAWRDKYAGNSWLYLVPFTLILLFAAGVVFQYIYGFNSWKANNSDDIVLVIDSSGSTSQTDPDKQRFEAAKTLIGNMKSKSRVAIISFNHEAVILQPMTFIQDTNVKKDIYDKIDANVSDGGTDIGKALDLAYGHILENRGKNRTPMVFMLSDGINDGDLTDIIARLKGENIPVYTVGLMIEDAAGTAFLTDIADKTGGLYTNISNIRDLKSTFQNIYMSKDKRLLADRRHGTAENSIPLALARILLITMIGILTAVGIGFVFDNRRLVKGFGIGGAVSGLLAGIILEAGFAGAPQLGPVFRLLADLCLAAVFTLFSLAVPMDSNPDN